MSLSPMSALLRVVASYFCDHTGNMFSPHTGLLILVKHDTQHTCHPTILEQLQLSVRNTYLLCALLDFLYGYCFNKNKGPFISERRLVNQF